MATAIRISTGALTAERTFANDAAAQAILLRCAARIGATGTNAQKLQAVVDWLVLRIQEEARNEDFDVQRTAILESIQEGNRLT